MPFSISVLPNSAKMCACRGLVTENLRVLAFISNTGGLIAAKRPIGTGAVLLWQTKIVKIPPE